jgi:tetratricopeptide (TPR) repeat protein
LRLKFILIILSIFVLKNSLLSVETEAIQKHLIKGYELLTQGKPQEAIEEFKIVIKEDPSNPDGYGGIGDAYSAMAEFKEAIEYYKKAIERAPDNAQLYSNLGMVYSYEGDNETAVKMWQKASKLNPGLRLLHYNIGYYYYLKEDYKRAIVEFKEELKLNPQDAPSYFYLARSYAMLNDEENALKNFDNYLKYETDPVRLKENQEKINLIKKLLEESKKIQAEKSKQREGEGK